jgi:hypothetical protein
MEMKIAVECDFAKLKGGMTSEFGGSHQPGKPQQSKMFSESLPSAAASV